MWHIIHLYTICWQSPIKAHCTLLPDVHDFFNQKLKEVTQQRCIESDTANTITAIWLRSQLQPHMTYRWSCGTVLYRYGGDLLHALNVALGQVRDLTQKSAGAQSDEQKFQHNLSETCLSLNSKLHARIKRMIKQDASSPHRIEDINIDSFIQDLDPDIWKAIICLLTQPLSSTAKKGTDFSNHLRKVRRCFCLCVIFFTINSHCSFPMHTFNHWCYWDLWWIIQVGPDDESDTNMSTDF